MQFYEFLFVKGSEEINDTAYRNRTLSLLYPAASDDNFVQFSCGGIEPNEASKYYITPLSFQNLMAPGCISVAISEPPAFILIAFADL